MSDYRPAISMRGVGKMYKVFSSRLDNFIDAMGLSRFVPWWRMRYREYWALRDITVDVPRGKRLGIIGCNGAGKTTLLKLITGNLPVTEGDIQVNGHVHALMTTGSGFHPEFTGRENIEASLVYQGFTSSEIKDAIEEVAEFTELEQFLDQPFKTYSAGMQARLTFATATSMSPDILIVDEVLGAGDGYFIAKSTERITRLVEDTGATVLLVSHALDQTVRFCDETIWIDRGRIVQRGPTLEVVKAYEQYLRVRNERRLRAKNKLRAAAGDPDNTGGIDLDMYNDHLMLRFVVSGPSDATFDLSEVAVLENGELHDRISVGDAQDADTSRPAFVRFDDSHCWSGPQTEQGRHFRSVALNGSGTGAGSVMFYFHGIFDDASYAAEVTYRCTNAEKAAVEIWKGDEMLSRRDIPAGDGGWITEMIEVATRVAVAAGGADNGSSDGELVAKRVARRWPSQGTLLIHDVKVTDPNGQEQAVFTPGQAMVIRITVQAQARDTFPIRAAVSIFRLDGIQVTRQQMPEPVTLELDAGSTSSLVLTMKDLRLCRGNYVFSVALFSRTITEKDRYDLIDRAYEFEVVTSEPQFQGAVFHHPALWSNE